MIVAAVEKTLNTDPSESDELECLESTGFTVDCPSIQNQENTVMKDDRNEMISRLCGGLLLNGVLIWILFE